MNDHDQSSPCTSTSAPSTTPTLTKTPAKTPAKIPAPGYSASSGTALLLRPVVAGDQGSIRVAFAGKNASFLEYPATCLAVLGDVALVEYTCGNGTTALAFVRAVSELDAADGVAVAPWVRLAIRPSSYRHLLKPWLVAVVEQSGTWKGIERRHGEPVPSPRELITQRFVLRRAIGAVKPSTKDKIKAEARLLDRLLKKAARAEVRARGQKPATI